MAGSLERDTVEEIEAVVEQEAEGLSAKEKREIVEVSVSVDEARNRARARIEGRAGEDDSVTEGSSEVDPQALEVERAAQGDAEHQAARRAEARDEDPGKAVKEAKKTAVKEGREDVVTNP